MSVCSRHRYPWGAAAEQDGTDHTFHFGNQIPIEISNSENAVFVAIQMISQPIFDIQAKSHIR